MGFDITYHPIREHEIQHWYFDAMNDVSLIERIALENNIEPFYKDKYEDIILFAKEAESTELFDMCHGRYISLVQGFFRTYFYTRNSAFSFLIDRYPDFKKYTKGWTEVMNRPIENPVNNKITENYSSGVFIPLEQVEALLCDYRSNKNIQKVLDDFYSNERIAVFIKALEFSKKNKMGILEAAEVVEPNVRELNNSLYYSNMYNCDQEGLFLYIEAAMKKIKEAEKNKNTNLTHCIPENRLNQKKGFWKRLFE
ncbi:hypothetical protein [Chryseobacterium sp. SIMBA_028]|uniref:hypothetical protein n=1 Tax=Chryseobacterium sp. SIMBA_028 TaxID=3085771 RepID=UPI00397C3421